MSIKRIKKNTPMKRFITLLVFSFILFKLSGQEVSFTDAKQTASNFFYSIDKTPISLKSALIIKVDSFATYYATKKKQLKSTSISNEPAFYIFNRGDKPGFVIVSGDKKITEIIAYSNSSVFCDLNTGLKALLSQYVQEISFAKENNITENTGVYDYNLLADGGWLLGEIEWNQNPDPYNTLCPPHNGSTHCPIGCQATVLGQILKYYKFPKTGTGSHSYTSAFGLEYASFGTTDYNYSLMPEQPISNIQNSQIATLLYHSGVSQDMNYALAGSGTPTIALPNAFRIYFGYQANDKIDKSSYSWDDWKTIIKNEIDVKRPVAYRGVDPGDGAHIFILDGYNNMDQFHINWGWGSSGGNGYFLLTSLLSFTNDHEMVVGIEPKLPDLTPVYQSLGTNSVQAGSNLTVYCAENNSGPVSAGNNVISIHLSVDNILTPGANEDIYLDEISIPGVVANSCSNVYSKSIGIPSNVLPGSYYVFFSVDGGEVVNEIFENNNFATVILTVTSGTTLNPPHTLTSTVDNGQVSLNWSAPSSGTPTSYKIYQSTSQNGTYTPLSPNITSTNKTITGLTNGTTYWFYVTAIYSSQESVASNKISATPTSSTSLSNDEPCNADLLTVQTSCNYVTKTIVGATKSAQIPDASCDQPSNVDVWFKFTIPSGNFGIHTNSLSISGNDCGLAIYTGNCSSMVEHYCTKGGNPSQSYMPWDDNINLSAYAGQTGYIRVWEFGTVSQTGDFQICITQQQQIQTCTYSLSQTSRNFSYNGGAASFTIYATAGAGCSWNVSTSPSSQYALANITSLDHGAGPYTITYYLDPNPTNHSLSCTLTVTGNNGYSQDYLITQDANVTCDPAPIPTTADFSSGGGTGSFYINVCSGCSWFIYNSCSSMLTNITPTQGVGPATVSYNVLSNPNSTSRSCAIRIQQNNKAHTITQQGNCTAPISPTSATASLSAITSGQSTILQEVGGSLNSAADWVWYTGSCGTAPIGNGPTLTVSQTTTTTYYVQATACGTSTTCQSVTVYSLPASAGTISGTTNVCRGQNSVAYTVPSIANANSYVWTLPTGATGTSSTNTITVNYGTSAVSGNITVKGINSYGDGPSSTLAINVNSLPANAGVISGPTTVCQGQSSVNYSVPTIASATSYVWTLPAGATGSSSTNSITVNYSTTAASGNITVKGNSACGDGGVSTLGITVNSLPASAGTISGASTVCKGQNSVIYTVPAIANATTYVWSLPSGATGSSSTNSITVNYGASAVSGNITVKGNNSCGDGGGSTLAINVNSLPANAGIISGATTVCQGQNSVNYSVPTISNATSYVWTLPAGATGTSSTNSITVNYSTTAASGNITVKGNSSCGDGGVSNLPIIVNPLPAAAGTISGAITVCKNQNSVSYNVAPIANATSYVWSLPSGVTGSSTTNTITVNFGASAISGNITVKGNNSCGDGVESAMAVTVITGVVPKITAKWGNVLICSNVDNAISKYQWYKGGSAISNANAQYYTTGKLPGIYMVETIDKDGCKNISNTIPITASSSLLAYPNPASVNFTLKLSDESEGRAVVSLVNANGIKVMEFQTEKLSNELIKEIPVNNLAPGIYVVHLLLNQKDSYVTKIEVRK